MPQWPAVLPGGCLAALLEIEVSGYLGVCGVCRLQIGAPVFAKPTIGKPGFGCDDFGKCAGKINNWYCWVLTGLEFTKYN